MIERILIAGSGNMAWHWVNMLTQFTSLYPVVHLYARNRVSSDDISKQFQVKTYHRFEQLDPQFYDLVILAVSDDAVETLSSYFINFNAVVVHCSGALPMHVLHADIQQTGVLYPLQTFTKGREPDYAKIHFFPEGSSPEITVELEHFIRPVSPNIHFYSGEQRLALHLAAVIANNFTNHFMVLAHQICNKNKVDFSALLPMMEETLEKLKHLHPANAQTGPAVRGNRNTIQQHLKVLENDPHIAFLYKALSESIINFNQSNKKQS
ncbi:MAG: DUF2520 domain-containing protein [Bacteroidetes bacterium]|jgi:predicted short-subunit dehydrogenase-like oxidoreductase (DUF2520 family)|nr:DUF2520 domain-containing protein [Bacteroidota bacterium]